MLTRRLYVRMAMAGALLMTAACDSVPLMAPTSSTITVSAPTRVLPLGGSTEVSAFVLEQSGTPVQNGTVVRFTSTLGSLSPVEAETRNGIAVATFLAGGTSGIAEVRASSGGATGGAASTGTVAGAVSTGTNVMQITIGAAAVNTVTLRANPGSVSPSGGTVELIANVVTENGRAVEAVPVTFNTDQGILTPAIVNTNSAGDARTVLTVSQKATVTATAGIKTSSAVVVDVRPGPGLTFTCAPASGTGNCAAVQASSSSNTVTVLFNISRTTTSSALRTASIDFGDGASQSLGNLAGAASVPHTYTGPSSGSQTPRSYTATVTAVDINNETTSAATTVSVTPRPVPTPIRLAFTTDTCATGTTQGQRCSFVVAATGGGDSGTGDASIETYTWNFGDGSSEVQTSGPSIAHIYTVDGRYTVTAVARTPDGRTARAQTEVLIDVP